MNYELNGNMVPNMHGHIVQRFRADTSSSARSGRSTARPYCCRKEYEERGAYEAEYGKISSNPNTRE